MGQEMHSKCMYFSYFFMIRSVAHPNYSDKCTISLGNSSKPRFRHTFMRLHSIDRCCLFVRRSNAVIICELAGGGAVRGGSTGRAETAR